MMPYMRNTWIQDAYPMQITESTIFNTNSTGMTGSTWSSGMSGAVTSTQYPMGSTSGSTSYQHYESSFRGLYPKESIPITPSFLSIRSLMQYLLRSSKGNLPTFYDMWVDNDFYITSINKPEPEEGSDLVWELYMVKSRQKVYTESGNRAAIRLLYNHKTYHIEKYAFLSVGLEDDVYQIAVKGGQYEARLPV